MSGDALPARFWVKVEKTETCWLWVAALDRHGYGKFRPGGRAPMGLAHRVAYTALVGPIPDGLGLDHLCRVRACVNPDHLEPVTQRENIIRGDRPALARNQGTCRNGLHPWPESRVFQGGKKACCYPCLRANRVRADRRRSKRVAT